MKAAQNTVVKLSYELRNEAGGPVVDSATNDAPFSFLFGHANVLEHFEKGVADKSTGDKFEFSLTAEEGYGPYDDKALVELDKNVFSVDGQMQDDILFVGNTVPLQDQHGNPFQGKITSIEGEKVTVDLNHPLAGKALLFTGEILDVREATATEIEHGHVHEPTTAEAAKN